MSLQNAWHIRSLIKREQKDQVESIYGRSGGRMLRMRNVLLHVLYGYAVAAAATAAPVAAFYAAAY